VRPVPAVLSANLERDFSSSPIEGFRDFIENIDIEELSDPVAGDVLKRAEHLY